MLAPVHEIEFQELDLLKAGIVSRDLYFNEVAPALGALSSGIVPLLAGFGSGFLGLSAPFFVGGLLVAAAWGMMVLNHRRYA